MITAENVRNTKPGGKMGRHGPRAGREGSAAMGCKRGKVVGLRGNQRRSPGYGSGDRDYPIGHQGFRQAARASREWAVRTASDSEQGSRAQTGDSEGSGITASLGNLG